MSQPVKHNLSNSISHSQISQQLDVISRLERDLNESSRELENLKEKTADDVSVEGELFLNNNSITNNNTDSYLPQE